MPPNVYCMCRMCRWAGRTVITNNVIGTGETDCCFSCCWQRGDLSDNSIDLWREKRCFAVNVEKKIVFYQEE